MVQINGLPQVVTPAITDVYAVQQLDGTTRQATPAQITAFETARAEAAEALLQPQIAANSGKILTGPTALGGAPGTIAPGIPGRVLVDGGSSWTPQTVSGDGTLSSAGALTVAKSNGTAFGGAAFLAAGGPNGAAVLDGSGNLSANSSISTGTATARTLASRGADWVNVKDYGAALDGTTSDSVAFQAAYNAAANNGILEIPVGNLNGSFTSSTSKSVLWRTMGSFDYGTSAPGTNPVTSFGDGDVLETFLGGRKRFSKTVTSNTSEAYAVVEVDYTQNGGNGVSGNVSTGLLIAATQNAIAPNPGVWAINAQTTITNTAGDNVGIGSSTVIDTTGAGTSIALYSQVIDNHGDAGGTTSCEFDVYTVAADPIGTSGPSSGKRAIVVANAGIQGSPSVVPEVSRGIGLGCNGIANMGVGFYLSQSARLYYAAFDCSQATFLTTDGSGNSVKVAAFSMAAGMPIDFTRNPATSTFNHNTLSYFSGALNYSVGGTSVFKISDVGTISPSSLVISGNQTIAINLTGTSTVGFDTAGGTFTNAIRMAADQTIAWESTGSILTRYDGTAQAWQYLNGSTVEFQIGTGGNVKMLSGSTLQIGSSYTAGTITPTGYIEITDSSGTVRKIPCL